MEPGGERATAMGLRWPPKVGLNLPVREKDLQHQNETRTTIQGGEVAHYVRWDVIGRSMEITFDQFSQSVDIPEGVVTLAVAEDIISRYIEGQKDFYQSEEDSFAISVFAFRKSWKEFIEIAIDSKTDYRVRYECKRKKKLWFLNWLYTFDKDLYVPDAEGIAEIVRKFYVLNSDEFHEYFSSISYKESKHYS